LQFWLFARTIAASTVARNLTNRGAVERQDLERIARAALKELGVPNADLTLTEDGERPGHWRIDLRGAERRQLKIRCSEGTSPQFVREQVFDQFAS
jgi:hypothetical protein